MGQDQHRCLQRRPQQHLHHGAASRRGFGPLPPLVSALPWTVQQGRIHVRNGSLLVGLDQAAAGKGQETGKVTKWNNTRCMVLVRVHRGGH
jgi:hypothetical protein